MRLLPFAALALLALPLSAQKTTAADASRLGVPASAPRPEPQVNPDRTVTFRVTVPGAAKVALSLEGTHAPIAMVQQSGGVWTLTTAALAPEYYSYHFEVDGHTQLDANNPIVKAGVLAVGNSFLVPATPAAAWETTAVPHGTIHHQIFTSKVVKGLEHDQDDLFVYTPPGYDAHAATKYPVLYLLHGWSDTAGGWTAIGHANDIFDNLIAQGKAKPMIVVMPLGYGDMSFVRSGFGVWQDPTAIDGNVALFQQSLFTEVIPMVESGYNVAPGRENHAIAGLSMGGLEALTTGLTHTDQFAYVGGFSSAVHMLQPSNLSGLDPKTANLKLLWIACGTSDDLITANQKLVTVLKSEGLPVTAVETPGMHTWLVWRDNLTHFAPLLFER